MIKGVGYSVLAIAFLPIAMLMISLGINAIKLKRSGVWLKIALIINTSLAITLGVFGSVSSSGCVTCYKPIESDETKIPEQFEDSDDWLTLESNMTALESYIRSDAYNQELIDSDFASTQEAIENLRLAGGLSNDAAELLLAYCTSRYESYTDPANPKNDNAIPDTLSVAETAEDEIINILAELREMNRSDLTESPGYNSSIIMLEQKLAEYTGENKNLVLRQLLLDIVDGRSGRYFTDDN